MTRPSRQFLVYVLGGVLSAVVDIGLLQFLLMSGAGVVAATSAGFVAGVVVNYAYHARVTFKNVSTWSTLARFLCVVAINYLLTLGLVALAVAWFDLALVGKLVSLPVVALNGFFLSKFWIFR